MSSKFLNQFSILSLRPNKTKKTNEIIHLFYDLNNLLNSAFVIMSFFFAFP